MTQSLKSIGEDVYLSSNAEIKRPELCEIGSHVAIDSFVYITTQMSLGDYIHISPHVSIIGGKMGTFTAVGFNNIMAGARIICVSDRFDDSGLFGAMIPDAFLGNRVTGDVLIEPLANIGTNAVMLPGSKLRMGSLLTIGSVLFGDTEPWTVYSGNPAKPTRKINPTEILKRAKALGYEF